MSTATLKEPAIDRIEQLAKAIKGGGHKVKPGQPLRFSEASVLGDTIAQGDLYIVVFDLPIPERFKEVKEPVPSDMQLVPGNTQGAKHCLDSLDGVKLFRPIGWNMDSLIGPIVKCEKERVILHPTHGPVTVLAGMTVLTGYQQELEAFTQRLRRNAD